MSKRSFLSSTAIGAIAALLATILVASPLQSQTTGPELCNGLVPTIVGTSGDDVLQGTFMNDVIVGLGGDDVIRGASGEDTICGGDGDDEIHGESQSDTIFGEAGNDTITGADGADVIDGGPGNDNIRGDSQNDVIQGGNGDDDINGGSGDDTLDGGNGVDVVDGSFNNDTCDDAETAISCETETQNGEPDPEPATDTDGDGIPDSEDPDIDNDGTPNEDDAFPLDANEDTDTDGDGVGDNIDEDIDGDGTPNVNDAFPLDPNEDTDTDGDGVGNNADEDDDNDGIPDVDDPNPLEPGGPDTDTDGDGVIDVLDDFPNDPNESSDTDGDGTGDNADPDADNDGVPNDQDAFPLDDSETVDSDGGGLGDNADPDDDDDGVFDEDDAFPFDSSESADTDGDGIGDNADPDDDGDGVLDVDDDLPLDDSESTDSDLDGIGDNADDDDDNDGVVDSDDAFPLDRFVSTDSDGDGVGDAFETDSDGDGVIDIADAFPTDSSENSDADFDGIGDNADDDDDNDGVLDSDDAFPFDPDESVDDDGNGVGDTADSLRDSDDDGIADIDDLDLDGDLVPNDQDAFPLISTEQVDTDGDGLGDGIDDDDDGDGVADVDDLLPLDASVGPDSDGDGTPDSHDLDPDSADEQRFQVEQTEISGAAASVVSNGLILETELVITPTPIVESNPIERVSASPIVDFTIDGPLTDFETARITIPIDPALAQQPDPVEVWWFNEDLGLWVPDGTDLIVDPAAATVSVTVDHFSQFVALRRGTTADYVPAGGANQCVASSLNVAFLVDVSGSNQFRFIIDGVQQEPSDFNSNLPFEDPPERIRVVSDVLSALEGFDQAALVTFAEDAETADLGDGVVGSSEILLELNQAIDQVESGTDILGALDHTSELLTSTFVGNLVIVLVTDGGNEVLTSQAVDAAVDDGVIVHAIGIGDEPNPTLAEVTSTTGGVFAPDRSDPLFASLTARLGDLNRSDVDDFDNDGLSDCEEENGVPLVDGIRWTAPGVATGVNFHEPEFWISTELDDFDTDGDFLWDSEEYVITDLQGVDGLDGRYQNLIDNGITRVFRFRSDPNDASDPVAADGTQTRNNFTSGLAPSVDLTDAKLARQIEVETALANSPGTSAAALASEAYALSWYTGIRPGELGIDVAGANDSNARTISLSGFVGQRAASGVTGVSNVFNGLQTNALISSNNARFGILFNFVDALSNRDLLIDSAANNLLSQISEIEVEQAENPSQARYWALDDRHSRLMLELGQIVLRARSSGNGSPEFAAETPAEVAHLINQLRANTWLAEDPGDITSDIFFLDARNAYRLVLLFAGDEAAFDRRVSDILDVAFDGANTPPAVLGATPDGLTRRQFEQFALEVTASQDEQLRRAIEVNSPETPFLSEAEEAAFAFIQAQFTDGGLAEVPAQSAFTSGLVTVVGVDEASVTFRDVIDSPAFASLDPAEQAVLRALWNDVAFSDRLGGAWIDRTGFDVDRSYSEPEAWVALSISEFVSAFVAAGGGGTLVSSQLTSQATLDSNFPGLITRTDLQRFQAFMQLRQLAPADNPQLNNDNDLVVNEWS